MNCVCEHDFYSGSCESIYNTSRVFNLWKITDAIFLSDIFLKILLRGFYFSVSYYYYNSYVIIIIICNPVIDVLFDTWS